MKKTKYVASTLYYVIINGGVVDRQCYSHPRINILSPLLLCIIIKMIYHRRRSHIPLLWALFITLFATSHCQAAATVDVNLTSRPRAKPSLTTRGGSVVLSLPSWSNKIIAGGTSRAIAQALLYPVDALRTLAQTRGKWIPDLDLEICKNK